MRGAKLIVEASRLVVVQGNTSIRAAANLNAAPAPAILSQTVTNAAHSACAAYPAGTDKDNGNPIPFGGGCQPTMMDGGTLRATCPNYFGVKGDTSLADAASGF
jgi:hypothetical protein